MILTKSSVINITDKLNNYLNNHYAPDDMQRVVTWLNRFSVKMHLVQLEVGSFDDEHLLPMLYPNFDFSKNSPKLARNLQFALDDFATLYCQYLNLLDNFGVIAVPKNK